MLHPPFPRHYTLRGSGAAQPAPARRCAPLGGPGRGRPPAAAVLKALCGPRLGPLFFISLLPPGRRNACKLFLPLINPSPGTAHEMHLVSAHRSPLGASVNTCTSFRTLLPKPCPRPVWRPTALCSRTHAPPRPPRTHSRLPRCVSVCFPLRGRSSTPVTNRTCHTVRSADCSLWRVVVFADRMGDLQQQGGQADRRGPTAISAGRCRRCCRAGRSWADWLRGRARLTKAS